MKVFRGRFQHSLDDKGRVAIPQRFRETLGNSEEGSLSLVITVEPDECLVVYPEPSWRELESKVATLPQMNEDLKVYLRFTIGWATDCQLDRQGRILIPQPLREYARLERDVWFVGMLNKFEIWNGDRLSDITRKERIRDVAQSLAGLF
jgi:MraZ protein